MQTILAIIFILALTLFLVLRRKKIILQKILYPFFYIIMYRTSLGLSAMDWLAKRAGFILRPLSTVGIVIGFLGMAFTVFEAARTVYLVFSLPAKPAGIGVIQPFVPNVPGTIFVPFLYFLVCIAIIAIIHEFAHGVIARCYDIKVKSSGFAFMCLILPIIPAAFVEPDEKTMNRRPVKHQLAVFAAGPVINIILGLFVLGLFALVLEPVVLSVADFEGIHIVGFSNQSPASLAGMSEGELITHIDGKKLDNLSNYGAFLTPYQPGQIVEIRTNVSIYPVTLLAHPQDPKKAYIGITPKPQIGTNPQFTARYGEFTANLVLWFIGLMFWLYLLSMGIGFFNMMPLGPVDGGRMFYTLLSHYLPQPYANRIFGITSAAVFGMILVTLAGIIFF